MLVPEALQKNSTLDELQEVKVERQENGDFKEGKIEGVPLGATNFTSSS